MMQTILHWDTAVFHLINSGWSNPVFDVLLTGARNKFVWLPLYVFCISWILFNCSGKQSLYILLLAGAAIFASDTISSSVIKYQVRRPRPCHEMFMDPPVIQRVPCGGGFSFTSSHASNHFCLAAFLVTVFGGVMGRYKHLWWLWAGTISLAQVYVGLHYPLDILCGGILGALIGWSFGKGCLYLIPPIFPATSLSNETAVKT